MALEWFVLFGLAFTLSLMPVSSVQRVLMSESLLEGDSGCAMKPRTLEMSSYTCSSFSARLQIVALRFS